MNSYLHIPFVVLVLLLSHAARTETAGDRVHGLTWERTEVEVQASPASPVVEAWFSFANRSREVVQVLAVKSSCDCLVAQLDRKTYYPGEDGVLLATLELQTGQPEASRQIHVTTRTAEEEPQTTILRLTVRLRD